MTHTRRALFLGIMALALIQGALYLSLVPPWDHYDEPTHFEYGWLIANRLRLPQKGDQDTVVRHEIAASMLEEGFSYKYVGSSQLLPGVVAPRIGISELVHPPLYYILVAVPLRFVRYADVRVQLYVARGVSLLLYLVTVACAWGIGEEVTQSADGSHPPTEETQRHTESKGAGESAAASQSRSLSSSVALCVPFFLSLILVLVPGFVDMMTAVNSDAGAVAAFSVFLWAAVRAIRRRAAGERAIGALIGCTLAALICPFVKNTASVSLVLLPLVWVWALLPPFRRLWNRRTRILLVFASLLLAGVALGLIFSWGNAAQWVHLGIQSRTTRAETAPAPLGEAVLVLEQASGQLRQYVPSENVRPLRDNVVTLGAWIWSTEPAEVMAPDLMGDLEPRRSRGAIQIGREPAFYVFTDTLSSEADHLYITLYAASQESPSHPPVYYDGVVVAGGDRAKAAKSGPPPVPQFDGPEGTTGTWAGWGFKNLVRNGSAERAGPYVRSPIERVIQQYARRSASHLLVSVLDWERSAGMYPLVAGLMLQTFWARFGWNHIPLPEPWYWVLGAVSLFCLAGTVVGMLKPKREYSQRRALLLLGLAGIIVWANAVLRFHPLKAKVFVPVARYAYPAILPTVLVLVGGAWTLTRQRLRWLRLSLLCGAVVLAGVSIWTLVAYPRYATMPATLQFVILVLCFPAGWIWGRAEGRERFQQAVHDAWQRLRTWWARQDKERLAAYVALVVILLAALATRAWYSTLGLPYMHMWDEPQITHTALQMLKSGDLDPQFYNYGSLLIYANLGVDALHYLYKVGQPVEADVLREMDQIEVGPFGYWPATGAYRWYVSHPSFLLWNRWLTALLGVSSVAAAFAIARQIGGLWAGVIAAAFLAGQPYYAQQLNSFALTDGPAAAFLTLACLLAVAYLQKKRPAHLIGAAAAVGLAASIKYNSAYGLVMPLAAAVIVRLTDRHRPPWWLWLVIPLICVFAFVLGTPYSLLDMPAFLRDVGAELYHYSVFGHPSHGHTILPGQPHLAYQLLQIVRNLGLFGTLFALLGLPQLVRRKAGWIPLILGGAALGFLTGATVLYHRNYAVLYPLLAVAQGCGLAWLCGRLFTWLAARRASRPWPQWVRAGVLFLVALAGVLYMGSTLRSSLEVKDRVETRTQAVQQVNALAQELGAERTSVGIASELQIHPLDLRQIDAELLYRLEPAGELACSPNKYELVVLPTNDGLTLTKQAVRALRQDDVPHVELGAGKKLPQHDPIANPGILIAVPPDGYDRPEGCAPDQAQESQEWPPAPMHLGDWEVAIPDRHLPDRVPPKPWLDAGLCADSQALRVMEETTATYSRLQERGTRMQLAVRGSVQTEPCELAPGTYRLQWMARSECALDECDRAAHALLQVSVWDHPPHNPPKRLHSRVLRIGPDWALHYELVRVTRSVPVSLEIDWIDGPGAPDMVEGEPQRSLVFKPRAQVLPDRELSLRKSLAIAWENSVGRLVWQSR